MNTEPRIDFVKFVTRNDGMPVITPEREDLVSLCVILNEWASPNFGINLPNEIKNQHSQNNKFSIGSEDDYHEVDIYPSETVLRRVKRTKTNARQIVSEFHFSTKEIIAIINKWYSLLNA